MLQAQNAARALITLKWISLTLLVCMGVILNIKSSSLIPKPLLRLFAPIIDLKMRYDVRHENIVVALSTTPYRIDKLQPVLDALYKQNANIKHIYLSVPYKFERDNLDYVIPAWLHNDQRVTLLRTNDYGPATKLLGVLEQVQLEPNTIVVTVDDDMFYGRNLILHLAHAAQQHPDSAVAATGGYFDYDEYGNLRAPTGIKIRDDADLLVTLVFGFRGVAYRAGFFDQSIFDINNAPAACRRHDDLYISFYLAQHGITRRLLPRASMFLEHIDWNPELGGAKDALMNVDPDRALLSTTCLAYLKARDPQVKF